MSGPEDPKVFDLDQVSCNFLGTDIESGFGDGAAIMIKKATPDFTTKVGADGSVTRSKNGSQLYEVTITLLQTASGNAKLSAINLLDTSKPNGAGIGPLMIADRQGTSLFFAKKAWIVQPPDVEYNQEVTNRAWTLAAVANKNFIGGN